MGFRKRTKKQHMHIIFRATTSRAIFLMCLEYLLALLHIGSAFLRSLQANVWTLGTICLSCLLVIPIRVSSNVLQTLVLSNMVSDDVFDLCRDASASSTTATPPPLSLATESPSWRPHCSPGPDPPLDLLPPLRVPRPTCALWVSYGGGTAFFGCPCLVPQRTSGAGLIRHTGALSRALPPALRHVVAWHACAQRRALQRAVWCVPSGTSPVGALRRPYDGVVLVASNAARRAPDGALWCVF